MKSIDISAFTFEDVTEIRAYIRLRQAVLQGFRALQRGNGAVSGDNNIAVVNLSEYVVVVLVDAVHQGFCFPVVLVYFVDKHVGCLEPDVIVLVVVNEAIGKLAFAGTLNTVHTFCTVEIVVKRSSLEFVGKFSNAIGIVDAVADGISAGLD